MWWSAGNGRRNEWCRAQVLPHPALLANLYGAVSVAVNISYCRGAWAGFLIHNKDGTQGYVINVVVAISIIGGAAQHVMERDTAAATCVTGKVAYHMLHIRGAVVECGHRHKRAVFLPNANLQLVAGVCLSQVHLQFHLSQIHTFRQGRHRINAPIY